MWTGWRVVIILVCPDETLRFGVLALRQLIALLRTGEKTVTILFVRLLT